MADQAHNLRKLMESNRHQTVKQSRIIAVTSGKGGVGKSNFTLNFALALQRMGKKVLIFDADLGFANIDLLMGVSPRYHLQHLLDRERTVWEVIASGTEGIPFIAGASGLQSMSALSEADLHYFMDQMQRMNEQIDYIFFDTGAGLSPESLAFILAADETMLITTSEPTSITDAYAVIKRVSQFNPQLAFRLIINRVSDDSEGAITAEKIKHAAKRFLYMDLNTLGYIPDDPIVPKSVKAQLPFTSLYPSASASKRMKQLAERYVHGASAASEKPEGIKGFLSRMLRFRH